MQGDLILEDKNWSVEYSMVRPKGQLQSYGNAAFQVSKERNINDGLEFEGCLGEDLEKGVGKAGFGGGRDGENKDTVEEGG